MNKAGKLAYIGVGSNLSQPLTQVNSAVQHISTMAQTQVIKTSSWYSNPPLGPRDQPDYVNGVVAINTELSPIQLLDALQTIENQHGRVRSRKWGERTLDLDILLYGSETIESERLTVPHREMQNRVFVIKPLFDIHSELILPNGKAIKDLVKQFDLSDFIPIGNSAFDVPQKETVSKHL